MKFYNSWIIGILILSFYILPFLIHAQPDSSEYNLSLFTDQKSLKVGDIITVYIMEFSSGSNQAGTSMKRKGDQGLDLSGSGALATSLPEYGFSFGKKSDFTGKASTQQKANLTAKISVRILEKISDEVLRIEGKREVNMNGDKQTIILKGIVRTQDVTSGNIVYSYNIADAKISYKGKGAVNQGQKAGLIFRILNWFL